MVVLGGGCFLMSEVPLFVTFCKVTPTTRREIGILLPNNQRQYRTLHIQKDELPYALR